jgi:hypothetical protein
MSNPAQSRSRISHEDIASLAYEAWVKAGQPANRDLEFWFLAERQLQTAAPPTEAPRSLRQTLEAAAQRNVSVPPTNPIYPDRQPAKLPSKSITKKRNAS